MNKVKKNEYQDENKQSTNIISQPKPQPEPQPSNMETHAHHLHKAPGRKWKHYFFEFLMLFLAIFCGFLAENFREREVEHQQAKQYMKSMIEDLANDTTHLSEVIENVNGRVKKVDTILLLYHELSKGYNPILRRNIQVVRGFPDFIKSDRTMQNLKNSGSMRLIQQGKTAESITEYDLAIRDLEIDVQGLTDIFNDLRKSWYEIFDDEAFEADQKTKTEAQLELANKNYLLRSDKPLLGRFNNEIRDYKLLCDYVVGREKKLKTQATDLIALLKKEYHLN